MGPLMADDLPCAMVALLRVFRMQTCTLLERTLQENRSAPGETLEVVPRLGTWCGVRRGETGSRRERHLGMGLQHLPALCCVQARKTCRFFEGMLLRRDPQQEERTGADSLQTVTDGETTCAPRLPGVRLHGASPP